MSEIHCPSRPNQKFKDIDPGLDRVRECLRTVCKCGFPLLMIHRNCRTTIEAIAGGYHYPKEGSSGATSKKAKPVKDGFYDNPADTVRYMGMLFYAPLFLETDPNILKMLEENSAQYVGDEPSWAWMDNVSHSLTYRIHFKKLT